MVSLKLFKHLVSREPAPTATSPEDSVLLESLMRCFGGRDNIVQVDACLTRLRVTVKSLAQVDNHGLQQAGALGVVILGHEVHAIFGRQSDRLRELMEARFFSQP